jgi:hypothetical protein
MPSTGGVPNTGGTSSTGGVPTGGTSSTGGVPTGGTSNTGGVPTGGTSSTGGAATGGSTSACPNYATNDACSRCICQKCANQVSGCFASNYDKATQCKQIQDCAQQNHCASTPCYCGSDAICLNPNGACRQVIETVVGSNSPLNVNTASMDQNHPLYRANQIGICETSNCKSECGLP